MDYLNFLDWLGSEKNMSSRSARDVVCRLKRVVSMLKSDNVDATSIELLNDIRLFVDCSMFIKSQLRRSVTLYLEHTQQK